MRRARWLACVLLPACGPREVAFSPADSSYATYEAPEVRGECTADADCLRVCPACRARSSPAQADLYCNSVNVDGVDVTGSDTNALMCGCHERLCRWLHLP